MAELNIFKETSVPTSTLPDAWYITKEGANPYFTLEVADASGTLFPLSVDVLGTLLAGYSDGADTPITSKMNIREAFTVTQGQLNNLKNAIAGGVKVPLPLDAGGSPDYPTGTKGDSYIITVAGKIGGANGMTVTAGDVVNVLNDNPGGDQATVGNDWYIIETNQSEANDTTMGYVRRATVAEVNGGTDVNAYVSPGRLRAGILNTPLTGLSTALSTPVTEADTIIGGFGKLRGQVGNRVVSNSPITGATRTKITYDAKGLVTGGADLEAADIPDLPASKITGLNAYSTAYNGANYSANESVDLDTAANVTFYAGSNSTNKLNSSNGQVASFVSSLGVDNRYGFQLMMNAGSSTRFGVRGINANAAGQWEEILTDSADQTITGIKTFRRYGYDILRIDRDSANTNSSAIQFLHQGVLSAFVGATGTHFGVRNSIDDLNNAPFRIELANGNIYGNTLRLSYQAPSVTGLAGSGDGIEEGVSYAAITGQDPNYPIDYGTLVTFKANSFRTGQLMFSTNGQMFFRSLHSTADNVWGEVLTKTAADAAYLQNIPQNGFAVRTGAGTAASRTIVGSESVQVTNGDGVAGDPVIKMRYAGTTAW